MFAVLIFFNLCSKSLLSLNQAWAKDSEKSVIVLEAKADHKEKPVRNQLEEIFVWRVSDELKLTVAEEKRFSEIIQDLAVKKNKLNLESQDFVLQMARLKPEQTKEREKILKLYRKNSELYQKLTTEEFDQMNQLLGSSRMAKYLQVKMDLTQKVKSILASEKSKEPSSKRPAVTKDIPPPKVIEE